MGTVVVNENTVKNPITLIGEMAGPCYGSDVSDSEKNYKRGLRCISDGHYRVLEFAETWLVLDGWSAKTIREFYTHIGGAPTRLQASTRYIKYDGFDYYVPPKVMEYSYYRDVYDTAMARVNEAYHELVEAGVPKEDASMLLPFGMTTTVSCRFNARTLMTMAEQRLCARAYHEYRQLMREIIKALSEYSPEWKTICDIFFKCKCDKVECCLESKSCGRWPKKVVD